MKINIEKAQVIKIGDECFVKVSSIRDAVDFNDHVAISLKRGTVAIHIKDDRKTKVYKSDATEYVPHKVKDITLKTQDRTTPSDSTRRIGFDTSININNSESEE